MDESETRSIEVSQAEAREIISGLATVETTASTESSTDGQTIVELRKRFEEHFDLGKERDPSNDSDDGSIPGQS